MTKVAALLLGALAGLAIQARTTGLEVVRLQRCDGGRSTPVDLKAVARNYERAEKDLTRALERIDKQTATRLKDGYESGLPRARGRSRYVFRSSHPLPERLRGATIRVVSVGRGQGVGPSKNEIVLVARAERLRDCLSAAPLTLLTSELAAALGIRAFPCRAVVSGDGKAVEIFEGAEE